MGAIITPPPFYDPYTPPSGTFQVLGDYRVTPPASVAGTPNYGIRYDGPAHTGLAIAEVVDVWLNTGRSVGFGAGGGTLATQRSMVVDAPTFTATAPLTITDAATVYVGRDPVAGANVTITNPYAMIVGDGTHGIIGARSPGIEVWYQGTGDATAQIWFGTLGLSQIHVIPGQRPSTDTTGCKVGYHFIPGATSGDIPGTLGMFVWNREWTRIYFAISNTAAMQLMLGAATAQFYLSPFDPDNGGNANDGILNLGRYTDAGVNGEGYTRHLRIGNVFIKNNIMWGAASIASTSPMLAPSGAALECKLADNTAYANFNAQNITAKNGASFIGIVSDTAWTADFRTLGNLIVRFDYRGFIWCPGIDGLDTTIQVTFMLPEPYAYDPQINSGGNTSIGFEFGQGKDGNGVFRSRTLYGTATNGYHSHFVASSGVAGTAAWANVLVDTAINTTSTGKQAALGISSSTNTSGGKVYLVDAGTTTTTWFTGYTSKWRLEYTGRIYEAALNSAPVDADLQNSEMSWYIDEAGNNLKARVKYSAGTLKTATIALV